MSKSLYTFTTLMCLLWLPAAQAQAQAQAQVPAYYYQGRHKVQVEVKTDALALDTTAPLSIATRGVSAALPAAILQTPAVPHGKVTVSTKGRNLSELTDQARRLRKSMPHARAQAILVSPKSSATTAVKYLTDEISFQIQAGKPTAPLAARYGLTDTRAVPYAANTFIATVDTTTDILAALRIANTMQESGDAEWAAPLIEEKKNLRSVPNDPFFPNQWHLQNKGTSNTASGVAGNDLNVVSAWDLATGDGVNIAISDEGVETSHPDLVANVRAGLDFDINDNDEDPTPSSGQSHGVACAGVAAARWNNGIGLSGVAPLAGIVGLRLLAYPTTDIDEGTAVGWRASEVLPQNQVSINSNSWGPNDTGKVLQGPGPLTEAAMEYGATTGRGGKGVIYAWAAGNGRTANDNINKDGYANSPWVIAVGATNSAGRYTFYSEPGAAMLVNAPGGEFPDNIYTTDITGSAGATTGDYRANFNGTSAAAPAVAGVAALMLQVNPELTYRDVMHIFVDTATRNDAASPGWKTNGSGREFSHDYGFGLVDAFDAVTSAASWSNLPAPAPIVETATSFSVSMAIPDNSTTGVSFTLPVSAPANFVTEHVELETSVSHPYRGNLQILLHSPAGMVSELMKTSLDTGSDYANWRFRSVAHWGEEPSGNWKITIADLAPSNSGSVHSATLRIRGYLRNLANVSDWTLY